MYSLLMSGDKNTKEKTDLDADGLDELAEFIRYYAQQYADAAATARKLKLASFQ